MIAIRTVRTDQMDEDCHGLILDKWMYEYADAWTKVLDSIKVQDGYLYILKREPLH